MEIKLKSEICKKKLEIDDSHLCEFDWLLRCVFLGKIVEF